MPGAFGFPYQEIAPPFGGRLAPVPVTGPSVTPFNLPPSHAAVGPSLVGGGSTPRTDGAGVMVGGLEKFIPKLRAMLDKMYGAGPTMDRDQNLIDVTMPWGLDRLLPDPSASNYGGASIDIGTYLG